LITVKKALEAERAKVQSGRSAARTAALANQTAVRRVLQRLIARVYEQRMLVADKGHGTEAIEEEAASGARQGVTDCASRATCSSYGSSSRLRPVSASYATHAKSTVHSNRLRPRPASARVTGSVSVAERCRRDCERGAGRLVSGIVSVPSRPGWQRPTSARAASFSTVPTIVRQDITTDELQQGFLELTDAEADAMIKVRVYAVAIREHDPGHSDNAFGCTCDKIILA
jgi:hypothetical protein